MPQLIRNGALVEDRWLLRRELSALSAIGSATEEIVPLAFWLANRDALIGRGGIGVWLPPDANPEALAPDAGTLPLIAVDFPAFTDGRGYSIGRLLRDRYAFKGELRAIGDILRDQLFALAECGFDAFDIRADRDAADALVGLKDFTSIYATTSRTPQPWFRRRKEAAAAKP